MVRHFVASITIVLGRCPKCMRQSFLAAFGASMLAAVAWVVIGGNAVTIAGVIAALGLTALWLAHLVAYAVRSVATSDGPRNCGSTPVEMMSRRDMIPTLARVFGAMALATALPASAAFAQNRALSQMQVGPEMLPHCKRGLRLFPWKHTVLGWRTLIASASPVDGI